MPSLEKKTFLDLNQKLGGIWLPPALLDNPMCPFVKKVALLLEQRALYQEQFGSILHSKKAIS